MKIALIAHDKKKSEIIELAKEYRDILANYELYATGTTGTKYYLEQPEMDYMTCESFSKMNVTHTHKSIQ